MDLDLDLPPSSSSGSRPSYIAFTSRASMHFPSSLPILPPLSLEQDQDRAPDSPLHLSSPSDGTGTPMGSHASRGLRRFAKRATFSQAQLAIMEEMWNQGEYPSVEQVDQCAKETGLTTKQVRTWFGNTRQARLAGTRKEARHAGIPGHTGTSIIPPRGRDTLVGPNTTSSSFSALSLSSPPSSGRNLGRIGGLSMFPPLPEDFAPLRANSGSRSRRSSIAGYATSEPFTPAYGFSASSSTGSSFGGFRGYGGRY
ncbi:MAG: hypothetical protein CYPHOPRED_001588 [Cyphobasidiales sp. Tagirdzhanova-0007]|nr:MAG: hypothetical protein CYPHOPRED_001588 [Cyphobasidiales sp. Tagirdzhanova-0007]